MTSKKFAEFEVLEGIEYLFKELWPKMRYVNKSYQVCKNHVNTITILINNSLNVNDLLESLSRLEGIGYVISSGLIYSMYENKYVPFDKYTLEYSYRLNIIPDTIINSNTYEKYSNKVVKYIKNSKSLNSIEDFVREAYVWC